MKDQFASDLGVLCSFERLDARPPILSLRKMKDRLLFRLGITVHSSIGRFRCIEEDLWNITGETGPSRGSSEGSRLMPRGRSPTGDPLIIVETCEVLR